MPRDDWRKARDRSVSRAAKREYAADGKSSYPYVWGDDPLRDAGDRPAADRAPPAEPVAAKAVWCVHDNAGVAVAAFEHRDRTGADELAGRLTRETGTPHYVALRKVAMPEAQRAATPARNPNTDSAPAAGSTSHTAPTRSRNPNAVPAAEPRPAPTAPENQPAEVPAVGRGARATWYHRLWQRIRRFWSRS